MKLERLSELLRRKSREEFAMRREQEDHYARRILAFPSKLWRRRGELFQSAEVYE
jgi:hypothetical protein